MKASDPMNGLCRMELKIWSSGENLELEAEFCQHMLDHLRSGQMTESPRRIWQLEQDGSITELEVEE